MRALVAHTHEGRYDMRNLLALLTVALLTFGCSSHSTRSITGPTSDGMSLSSDRGIAEQDRSHKEKGKHHDGDKDDDGDKHHDGDKDDDDGGGGHNNPGSGPGSALLKSAAGFAVFGASTITNTGPSAVNGDMGLNPGSAVTGFPPGTLTGTLHINDAAANQAKLDLQAAYNDLVGRPCNTVGPDLNSTLTPGVYCFSSSAQLSTALILDGQGNSNALFIFQIGSTLTTASNSSVTLINGASAANVFWQVGSSATLGTNTAFQGTIIANTSITVTTGSSILNGRAMALNGAVTLDSNLITTPGGGSGGSGNHGGDGDDDDDKGHGGHKHGHGEHEGHGDDEGHGHGGHDGHGDDGDRGHGGHGDR